MNVEVTLAPWFFTAMRQIIKALERAVEDGMPETVAAEVYSDMVVSLGQQVKHAVGIKERG